MNESKTTDKEKLEWQRKFVEGQHWKEDCQHYHGKLLTGLHAHWCYEWDGLPIDETVDEYDCCICDLSGLPDLPKSREERIEELKQQIRREIKAFRMPS